MTEQGKSKSPCLQHLFHIHHILFSQAKKIPSRWKITLRRWDKNLTQKIPVLLVPCFLYGIDRLGAFSLIQSFSILPPSCLLIIQIMPACYLPQTIFFVPTECGFFFSLQGTFIINAEIQLLFGFIYSLAWCMAHTIQCYTRNEITISDKRRQFTRSG